MAGGLEAEECKTEEGGGRSVAGTLEDTGGRCFPPNSEGRNNRGPGANIKRVCHDPIRNLLSSKEGQG